VPVEVPPEGENFMLIKGRISETKDMPSEDMPSTKISSKDETRLTTMAVEHKEEKKKTSEDIVGLNWEGSILALRLTAPDGTVIPDGFNNSSIRNIKGSNYEYYILKDVMPGNWTVEVVPVEVPPEGENFMLIKGRISETKDMPNTDLPTRDEPRLTIMAVEHKEEKKKTSEDIVGTELGGKHPRSQTDGTRRHRYSRWIQQLIHQEHQRQQLRVLHPQRRHARKLDRRGRACGGAARR
jgi:hypothetical protein